MMRFFYRQYRENLHIFAKIRCVTQYLSREMIAQVVVSGRVLILIPTRLIPLAFYAQRAAYYSRTCFASILHAKINASS